MTWRGLCAAPEPIPRLALPTRLTAQTLENFSHD